MAETVRPVLLKPASALETVASSVAAWTVGKDAAARGSPATEPKRAVAWSRWQEIDLDRHAQPRRLLLVAYLDGAFAVWDCSDVKQWVLVIAIQSLAKLLEASGLSLADSPSHVIAATFATSSLLSQSSRPLLCIAARLATAADHESALLIVEPETQTVLHHILLAASVHAVEAGNKALVVSTSDPIALHAFSTSTFEPLRPLHQIIDVAQNASKDEPVFCLGRDGRMLAYATSTKIPSQYERDYIKTGTGVVSEPGFFDSSSIIDPARIAAGSDFVRKISGSVTSGVRAVGDTGREYLRRKASNEATDERDNPPSTATDTPLASSSQRAATVPDNAGTIKIVDLKTGRIVSHFRPYSVPISQLSLSFASHFLLAAPTSAHVFDMFEIRTTPLDIAPVWHRYRLNRGLTPSQAVSTSWTRDGRFVCISTVRGTQHIFAIQPFGGRANLKNHFESHVHNCDEPQPLSISLSALTRLHAPRSEDGQDISLTRRAVAARFLDCAESHTFESIASGKPDPSTARPTSDLPRTRDLVVFDPETGVATLHRIAAKVMPTMTQSSFAAASRGDVGKLAANAVSGLTQMMRATSVQADGKNEQAVFDWQISSTPRAIWSLPGESPDRTNAALARSTQPRGPLPKSASSSCAQIEIETFSRSRGMVPRSIYQSLQFEFFSLPATHRQVVLVDNFADAFARLQMRPAVQIRSPKGKTTQQLVAGSFDDPLKSALRTTIEPSSSLSSSPVPASFPNGRAARQGGSSWREVAMSHVSHVGKELDRVREHAANARRHLRRKGSAAEYASSVSFEGDDDDAIFADYAHSEGSTTATSDVHEAEEDKLRGDHDDVQLDEPEAPWGFQGRAQGQHSPRETSAFGLSEEIGDEYELPFDELIESAPASRSSGQGIGQ